MRKVSLTMSENLLSVPLKLVQQTFNYAYIIFNSTPPLIQVTGMSVSTTHNYAIAYKYAWVRAFVMANKYYSYFMFS